MKVRIADLWRPMKGVTIVDLCVCMYEVDDPSYNLPKILMTATPMTIEVDKVGGNGFPTL